MSGLASHEQKHDQQAQAQDALVSIDEFQSRYDMKTLIGQGNFAGVMAGVDLKCGTTVAIKVELDTGDRKMHRLQHEGIVQIRCYAIDPLVRVLVTDMLGPSLDSLLRIRPLLPAEIVVVGCQMVDVLERLHGAGFIHRDISPANWCLARPLADPKAITLPDLDIRLIDFGLAQEHSKLRDIPHLPSYVPSGTSDFMGLNSHVSVQTRRDDLEAVGYVLVHLLGGKLPWSGLQGEELYAAKRSARLDILCQLLPELGAFIALCRGLPFDGCQYYRQLRHLLAENKSHTQSDKTSYCMPCAKRGRPFHFSTQHNIAFCYECLPLQRAGAEADVCAAPLKDLAVCGECGVKTRNATLLSSCADATLFLKQN